MSTKNWDIQKIGTWFLLLAFVVVSIILPVASPPVTIAETFTLIVSLGIISAFSLAAPQRVCAGYRCRIRPRSPPSR